MFLIQVFDADKQFLFTLPMPHPLSRYEDLIKTVESDAMSNPDVSFDPEDINRESQINNAELLGYIARWKNQGDGDPDKTTMQAINRGVISMVLGDPVIRKDFRYMAMGHLAQLLLPRTPSDDSYQVQWVRPTQEQKQEYMQDMDPDTLRMYIEQIDENEAYLTELIKRDQH